MLIEVAGLLSTVSIPSNQSIPAKNGNDQLAATHRLPPSNRGIHSNLNEPRLLHLLPLTTPEYGKRQKVANPVMEIPTNISTTNPKNP